MTSIFFKPLNLADYFGKHVASALSILVSWTLFWFTSLITIRIIIVKRSILKTFWLVQFYFCNKEIHFRNFFQTFFAKRCRWFFTWAHVRKTGGRRLPCFGSDSSDMKAIKIFIVRPECKKSLQTTCLCRTLGFPYRKEPRQGYSSQQIILNCNASSNGAMYKTSNGFSYGAFRCLLVIIFNKLSTEVVIHQSKAWLCQKLFFSRWPDLYVYL